MKERVLVVDDEPALRDAVSYSLRSEGYEVTTLANAEAALEHVSADPPDVIVLDVMLPGLSGVELCRRIRDAGDIPIVMLTARDAEVDRVMGLEAGADDYVTKPFSMAELISRVRAILRRRDLDRRGLGAITAGSLTLDPQRHRVVLEGRPVDVTPSEFTVLSLLASIPDRVFSRREIMQRLWDSEYVGDQRACDVHISNLRRKIERDPQHPERLLTVRGTGYKLVPL
jgi:two-component system, OmpR family, response regulator RegX3